MTDSMHAAVLHGLTQTPRYERFPEPVAGADDVVVQVAAAALKPVDKWMASGEHYAHFREFPVVCGADGVGRLEDGSRVAFFATHRPYGGFAERTLVPRGRWFPVPDEVDDVTAAAITNPGMAAWKAVVWRGGLTKGQTVLVLGATGTSGCIAVQLAKQHGAGRVIAAGRNQRVLDELRTLGADDTIDLNLSEPELVEAYAAQARISGLDLIVDYLWGTPAEALFTALTAPDLVPENGAERILHVQVGISAGETVALSANSLRSAPLEIVGSGSGASPTLQDALGAYEDLLLGAARDEIRIAVDPVPLAEIETAWTAAHSHRRTVFVPSA